MTFGFAVQIGEQLVERIIAAAEIGVAVGARDRHVHRRRRARSRGAAAAGWRCRPNAGRRAPPTPARWCDAAASSSVVPSNSNRRSVSGSPTRSLVGPDLGNQARQRGALRGRQPGDQLPDRRRARGSTRPRSTADTRSRHPRRRARTTRSHPRSCAARAACATSAVLPIPASPATNTT